MSYSEKQSDVDFLNNCKIELYSPEAMLAIQFRKIVARYAIPKTFRDADCILPFLRITQDLGIHHIDSLNLVDIVLDMEEIGVIISENEVKGVFELNQYDATVFDIIHTLLEMKKKQSYKSSPSFSET